MDGTGRVESGTETESEAGGQSRVGSLFSDRLLASRRFFVIRIHHPAAGSGASGFGRAASATHVRAGVD